jgi:predicted dehydrogenase
MKNKKMKGAIIGFGFIASKGHLPAYLERAKNENDVEIVAVCDICEERRLEIPKGVRFYTNYIDLLEAENKLDFVDISTHANEHYKIAKLALERGLHVLCEKPVATNVTDIEELISSAQKNERVIFPCHNYKHAPVIKKIRELICENRIGKINVITINTYRNTHAIGTAEWNPNWRRYSKLSGGGIGMDHGSHALYLAFEWMSGYPISVTASGFNFHKTIYDTEDNFQAMYEFENGLANIYLTWTAGVRKTLYSIHGENGAITVDDDLLKLSIKNNNENNNQSHKATWQVENYDIASQWDDSGHKEWFNSMFDEFQKAITNSDYLNREIVDALFCVQSITKAYESIINNSEKLLLNNVIRN